LLAIKRSSCGHVHEEFAGKSQEENDVQILEEKLPGKYAELVLVREFHA
jgi:hypothetical protein